MEDITITNWKEISEIGKNIVTVGAIAIGGWWSYKKFFREAEDESSVDIKLECKVIKTENSNYPLLTIKAQLCNNGKIPTIINLEKSQVVIYKINPTAQTREFYIECDYLKFYKEYNIPVNGTWDALNFALIEHPGIYHIWVSFALNPEDNKKFFSRRFNDRKKAGLTGWINNLLGKRKTGSGEEASWINECIVSSEIESSTK